MTRPGDLREREAASLMGTYTRQPVVFVSGVGSRLTDNRGRTYLDFLAGIAVMNVGHSHPRVVAAVREQVGRLVHVSNLYYTEPQVRLAERLRHLLGWGQVFFANSGAEANEAALKLARRWSVTRSGPERVEVVTAVGSFHGRTFVTLAATGQPAKHEPFRPLPPWFRHVPYGEAAALDAAVDERTSAVLLEPILGEGGVLPAPDGYLEHARRICDERGALLVLDEIQTGLGRTGRWFGFEHTGATPHILTLAKGLGAGLPIGACIAREDVAGAFGPGDHATTFGGGPVVCAAALAVLDAIEQEGLLEAAHRMGARLAAGLREVTAGNPAVREIRGRGLLVGLELSGPWAAEVTAAALDRGLVINNATPAVLRFAPPLVVTASEVDQAVAITGDLLSGYREHATETLRAGGAA